MKTLTFGWLGAVALGLGLAWTAEAAPLTLPLWPGTPPGDTNQLAPESDTTRPTDGRVAGRRVTRIGNVSQPTMTVYRPTQVADTGAAVVVCPGGGYHILAMDLEGTEVVDWLNSIGVTAILLKYRVPVRPGRERYAAPLQDAQRAMGLARQHADEWGIDPKKIGILGFSAGGHLSAVTSCNFSQRTYEPVDEADRLSCRPDFAVLVYPAYLTLEKQRDQLAPELKITQDTPPTFLVQTQDDPVAVECSLFYYLGLKRAKVPAEMHLYPTGGHGYGLRPTEQPVTSWPYRVEQWMRLNGLLAKTSPQP